MSRTSQMRIALLVVLASAWGVPRAPSAESVPDATSCADALPIDASDFRTMGRGRIVAKTLPSHGRQVAVLFAAAIDTTPAAFVSAVRHPAALFSSKEDSEPRAGRFSSPPRREDVSDVSLNSRDVAAIRRCRPGACDVKLSDDEMQRLQAAASVQEEFRALLVDRVSRYTSVGLRHERPLHDHETALDPFAIATALMSRSPWVGACTQTTAPQTSRVSAVRPDDEFLYWLLMTSTPKPTLAIVHSHLDVIEPPPPGSGRVWPEVVDVSRQVFASHYTNGFVALSLLLRGTDDRRYLVNITRFDVDGVQGWLGLSRFAIERKLRHAGAEEFDGRRRAIEAWGKSHAS